MHKRDFLRSLGATTIAALLGPRLWAQYEPMPAGRLAEDETFWTALRAKYRLKPDYINLEHGYYSMQSEQVLDAFIANVRDVNYQASYYMRTVQTQNKDAARARLAALAGCRTEELIITRNTTESLDTVIAGYDWKVGDEAVMAVQDYGAMLDQFTLQSRRYGMVNRIVSLPNDPRSDDEIVQLYANAITPKTRLLLVSHLVNITGQILPVRKVVDMAHARGVAVAVDGAHAFAHLDFRIPDLGADYYAASLHKWLGVPLGAGILYVKQERISGLWPLFGDQGYPDTDIRKLNHTGTHPVHTDLAIQHAITFHESIGVQRKEARMRYLQRYWTTQVRDVRNVVVDAPAEAPRAAGIANVGVADARTCGAREDAAGPVPDLDGGDRQGECAGCPHHAASLHDASRARRAGPGAEGTRCGIGCYSTSSSRKDGALVTDRWDTLPAEQTERHAGTRARVRTSASARCRVSAGWRAPREHASVLLLVAVDGAARHGRTPRDASTTHSTSVRHIGGNMSYVPVDARRSGRAEAPHLSGVRRADERGPAARL
ncbi:MAG: aminotransferase class V-fold PLP-dependent enzyme [Gemmatimonadaceae bacterium]|nr:aminotransferase class V-fold PLP-dependent enzyme [Gemmatimonadaceae bacterium]